MYNTRGDPAQGGPSEHAGAADRSARIEDNARNAEDASGTTRVRVPSNLLGKLLDHGKTSAYAVHLLAIKCGKGAGFVLNETDFEKPHNNQSASWRRNSRYRGKPAPDKPGYDIGRRGFRAGIALMKRV